MWKRTHCSIVEDFFPFGISLFHSQQNTRTAYFYIVIHLNQFLLGLHDPHNRKHHTRIVLFMHDTDLIFMLFFNLIFSVDSSDRLFYLETAGELPCTWCNLILKQTGKRCKTTFVFGNLMFPEFYPAVTVTPKKSSNKCCSI